jgi:hypothetical protein
MILRKTKRWFEKKKVAIATNPMLASREIMKRLSNNIFGEKVAKTTSCEMKNGKILLRCHEFLGADFG